LNSAAVLEAAQGRDGVGKRNGAAAGGGKSGGVKAESPGAAYSLCSVEGEAVIVECVKTPESGGGGMAIRLYESLGGRARTALRFSSPLAAAEETDMLEENGKALPFTGKELPLEFSPFEIKTLLVRFA
jgi:alpha-mannosidase